MSIPRAKTVEDKRQVVGEPVAVDNVAEACTPCLVCLDENYIVLVNTGRWVSCLLLVILFYRIGGVGIEGNRWNDVTSDVFRQRRRCSRKDQLVRSVLSA